MARPCCPPDATAVITAVDTSVLIAITKGEPAAQSWLTVLERAHADGEVVACERNAPGAEAVAPRLLREAVSPEVKGVEEQAHQTCRLDADPGADACMAAVRGEIAVMRGELRRILRDLPRV